MQGFADLMNRHIGGVKHGLGFDENPVANYPAGAFAGHGSLADITKAILEYVNKRVNKQSTLARIELLTEPFNKTATQKIRRFLYMDMASSRA